MNFIVLPASGAFVCKIRELFHLHKIFKLTLARGTEHAITKARYLINYYYISSISTYYSNGWNENGFRFKPWRAPGVAGVGCWFIINSLQCTIVQGDVSPVGPEGRVRHCVLIRDSVHLIERSLLECHLSCSVRHTLCSQWLTQSSYKTKQEELTKIM